MRAPALFLVAVALAAAACDPPQFPRETRVSNARNGDPWLEGPACPDDEPLVLHAEDLEPGAGLEVARGKTVRVHYLAKTANGEKLHDSRDYGLPIELVIGSGKTVCGFDRALLGMKPGGQRRVTVPARFAFGEAGRAPDVPPRSDLTFVIDLYLPSDNAREPHSGPVNPAGGGRRR